MAGNNKARRAIFLDRDGTINVDAHFLADPDRLELLDGSAEAIRQINSLGFLAVVVTNQSGVARGYFPEKTVQVINEKLGELLSSKKAQIDAFYYCPHHPHEGIAPYKQKCRCRKPKVGMVNNASEDFNINLEESYMIGDKEADIELAKKGGMKGILVKTGYGSKTFQEMKKKGRQKPVYVAENLLEAVLWIKKEEEKKKVL